MAGCHYADDEVRATIRQVHERSGYILDPHSAIGYLGITSQAAVGRAGPDGLASFSRQRIRRSFPRWSSR